MTDIIVRTVTIAPVADASSVISYRTYDIEHEEMEIDLRSGNYSKSEVIGAEVLPTPEAGE